MQQYFVNDQLALQHPVMLDEAQTHHVLHVMRMKNETLVRVADNSGIVMLAKIVINGNEVTAVPFEVVTQRESDETEITLNMSLIKGERWDMAIQKACELGVNRIVPLQVSSGRGKRTGAVLSRSAIFVLGSAARTAGSSGSL